MIDELALRINDLAVFAGLWKDPCVAAFFRLVQKSADRDRITVIRKAYAEFAHELYEQDEQDWTAYLQRRVRNWITSACAMPPENMKFPVSFWMGPCLNWKL